MVSVRQGGLSVRVLLLCLYFFLLEELGDAGRRELRGSEKKREKRLSERKREIRCVEFVIVES